MQDKAQTNVVHEPARRPIEVVRAVYEAYERRDLAAIQRLYHPDCELYQSELLPWGGVLRGHQGLMRFFAGLTAAIETRIEDEQLMEAGDRVVSIGRTRGHSLGNGTPFDLPAVHVYAVEDGMIRRYEAYVDTPGMLAALSGASC